MSGVVVNFSIRFNKISLYIVLLFLIVPYSLKAEGWHERGHDHRRFHGHDISFFTIEEREIWQTGYWRQEWHNGRFGWWWYAGGVWYLYEQPILPYPMFVSEFSIIENSPLPPSSNTVPMPPPVPSSFTAPSPQTTTPNSYFYCDNPPGYYPVVMRCNVPYRPVYTVPQR